LVGLLTGAGPCGGAGFGVDDGFGRKPLSSTGSAEACDCPL